MTAAGGVARVELTGAMELRKALEGEQRTKVLRAVARSLYQEGFDTIRASIRKVPVDTGRLRSSHYVAPPKGDVENPIVELGFGVKYAAAVHEQDRAYRVKGTGRLYLRSTLEERAAGYTERIASRARKAWEQGLGVDPIPNEPETAEAGELAGELAGRKTTMKRRASAGRARSGRVRPFHLR